MNGGVFQHNLSVSNETANEKFRVTDLICGERNGTLYLTSGCDAAGDVGMAPCPRPRADTPADDVSDAARDGACKPTTDMSSVDRDGDVYGGGPLVTSCAERRACTAAHKTYCVKFKKFAKCNTPPVNDQTVNMKT